MVRGFMSTMGKVCRRYVCSGHGFSEGWCVV